MPGKTMRPAARLITCLVSSLYKKEMREALVSLDGSWGRCYWLKDGEELKWKAGKYSYF